MLLLLWGGRFRVEAGGSAREQNTDATCGRENGQGAGANARSYPSPVTVAPAGGGDNRAGEAAGVSELVVLGDDALDIALGERRHRERWVRDHPERDEGAIGDVEVVVAVDATVIVGSFTERAAADGMVGGVVEQVLAAEHLGVVAGEVGGVQLVEDVGARLHGGVVLALLPDQVRHVGDGVVDELPGLGVLGHHDVEADEGLEADRVGDVHREDGLALLVHGAEARGRNRGDLVAGGVPQLVAVACEDVAVGAPLGADGLVEVLERARLASAREELARAHAAAAQEQARAGDLACARPGCPRRRSR